MISVRAIDRVPPQRATLAFRLLNTEVLPALRRVLGPRLLYPEVIHLRAPGHDQMLFGSTTNVTSSADGTITGVEAPCLAVADDDVVLRFLLVYELARFHELSTRKHAQIKVDKPDASTLWCAYFAHRVVSATGLVPVELLRGGGLGLPRAHELVWLKALCDVGGDEVGRLTERGGELADAIKELAALDLPQQLFDAFPDWEGGDPGLCATFFSSVGSLGNVLELLAEARGEFERTRM